MDYEAVESAVRNGVQWLRLLVETLGAIVIALGIAVAVRGLLRHMFSERGTGFNPVRLSLARYLALALELQLAADILSTAIAPSWDQIGKLAAIAVIRTALNFFLGREIEQEQANAASSPQEDAAASRARHGPGAAG